MSGCRNRIVIAAASVFLAGAGDLVGQVSRAQNGQILDANLRVGSGGVNTPVRSGGRFNSQLYVDGQVTGLGSFRGRVGYHSANSLRLRLPSDTLSRFRQESVGLRGAVGGESFRASPYYSRSSTVVGAGQIAAGRVWPGSSVPRTHTPRRLGRSPLSVARAPRVAKRLGPDRLTPRGRFPRPGAANVFDLVPRPDDTSADENPSPPAGTQDTSTRSPLTPAPPSVAGPRLRLSKTPSSATRGPARIPTVTGIPNEDVFTDMVAALNRRREQLKPKLPSARRMGPTDRRAVPVAPATRPTSTAPPSTKTPGAVVAPRTSAKPPATRADTGRYVRLDVRREIVLHALAGTGPDRFNRTMASAAGKLRSRRYYDAAAEYAFAASLDPTNPLARLGVAVSMFCAGEPVSSARQLRGAMLLYSGIMNVRLSLLDLVTADALKRQLTTLAARLETREPDVMLLFVAAYMHHSAGEPAVAKSCAKRLRDRAEDDPLLRAFADSLLGAPAAHP